MDNFQKTTAYGEELKYPETPQIESAELIIWWIGKFDTPPDVSDMKYGNEGFHVYLSENLDTSEFKETSYSIASAPEDFFALPGIGTHFILSNRFRRNKQANHIYIANDDTYDSIYDLMYSVLHFGTNAKFAIRNVETGQLRSEPFKPYLPAFGHAPSKMELEKLSKYERSQVVMMALQQLLLAFRTADPKIKHDMQIKNDSTYSIHHMGLKLCICHYEIIYTAPGEYETTFFAFIELRKKIWEINTIVIERLLGELSPGINLSASSYSELSILLRRAVAA